MIFSCNFLSLSLSAYAGFHLTMVHLLGDVYIWNDLYLCWFLAMFQIDLNCTILFTTLPLLISVLFIMYCNAFVLYQGFWLENITYLQGLKMKNLSDEVFCTVPQMTFQNYKYKNFFKKLIVNVHNKNCVVIEYLLLHFYGHKPCV